MGGADMLEQATQIPGYGLSPPSEEAVLASLSRPLTARRAQDVWIRACESVGIDRPKPPLSLAELGRISSQLAAEASCCVLGVSLPVRIETCACLAGLPSPFTPGEEE